MRGRASALAQLVAATVVAGMIAQPRSAVAEPTFWERVAEPQREKFERLALEARKVLAEGVLAPGEPGRARAAEPFARAEGLLRQAVALEPFDFATLFLLAEVESLRGHIADAAATLERAEPLARLPGQKASCWFRLGLERSRLGRYREAVASYDQQLALGETEATAYANVAEVLMALGRLDEAEDRYREAIRIDERVGDRRGREQSLAFGYYGLGVALDRDQQEVAAREAMGRAVAMDPNASFLRLAQQPGGDFSFLPEGDVYYYLGLASERAGNRDDAAAAFQEYLARLPRSPWAARARAHLAALAPAPGAAAAGAAERPAPTRRRWRVVAVATVLAQGPILAPEIDATLKQRPPAWEDCFAPFPPPRGHDTVRFAVEVEIDARGTVTRAAAKLPAPYDAGAVGACVEAALRSRLVVARPVHARATTARVEVLLANGDVGGV
jgi:tetratricopeptide (TPR) repeat protein